jgi:hypothetical protein
VQEYDASQFDGLCLCLENEVNQLNAGKQLDSEFKRLCEWLLDLSLELIRPEELSGTAGPGNQASAACSDSMHRCRLRVEERFPYFVKRIAKARIWIDSNGILFEKLQKAVEKFMLDTAVLCDKR